MNAIPVPSLGTQLDPDVLPVFVNLILAVVEGGWMRGGTTACRAGLVLAATPFTRHLMTLSRGLLRAGLPSVLEPLGLDRGDGKRRDGITTVGSENICTVR